MEINKKARGDWTDLYLLEQLDRSINCSLWGITNSRNPVEEGSQQFESGDKSIHGRLTSGFGWFELLADLIKEFHGVENN